MKDKINYIYYVSIRPSVPTEDGFKTIELEFKMKHQFIGYKEGDQLALPCDSGWFDEAFVDYLYFMPAENQITVFIKDFLIEGNTVEGINVKKDFLDCGWRLA